MAYITNDHRQAIALAAEDVAELIEDSRRLFALLGVICERLEAETPDTGTAAALAHIAKDSIMRNGGLHEVRACLAHLQRDFPLPEVPA